MGTFWRLLARGSLAMGSEQKVDWRRVSSTHRFEDLTPSGSSTKRTSRVAIALQGLCLIFAGLGMGTLSILAIVLSDTAAATGEGKGSSSLDWVRSDRYYCLLVPLTVPTIILLVILHWLSMKFYKH